MVLIPNAPRMGDMPKGEPVPDGSYAIRCDKATLKATSAGSKKPGAPMAECQFTITGPDEHEQYVGRKLFENLMLSGEGMFRTRQLLEAAGKSDDFVLEDTEQLVGLECEAVVQTEPERKDPESGKVFGARNKIAKFLAA